MGTLTEAEKAALSQKRGKLAASISDPDERRKFTAAQGEVDRKGGKDTDYAQLEQQTQNEENNQAVGDVLGSRKHGGPIHKTGLYQLHKGEYVMPANKRHNVSLYRAMHHLNHGGLHRALHVPEDETIPESKLEAAKHSSNPHVAHMAHFADTMEGFHHGD